MKIKTFENWVTDVTSNVKVNYGDQIPEEPSDNDIKELIQDIKDDFNTTKLKFDYNRSGGVYKWEYFLYDKYWVRLKYSLSDDEYRLEIDGKIVYSGYSSSSDSERVKTISKYLLDELKKFFETEYNKNFHDTVSKDVFDKVKRIRVDAKKYNI
jgi:hypothetical protein